MEGEVLETIKSDRRSDRERKRRQQNREAILHAAEAAILRRGCSATSMDDVAAEAEFSKATLYRYFKSKSELMLDIMVHFLDDLELQLAEIRSAPGRSVRDRLRDSIACLLEYMASKESLSRAFLEDPGFHKFVPLLLDSSDPSSSVRDGSFLARIRAHGDSISKGWETLLAEGVTRGELRPLDVPRAALFISAAIQGVFGQRFWPAGKPALTDNISLIFDFLWQGIMARSAGQGVAR
jgi:AcrR family transcriptional regulator